MQTTNKYKVNIVFLRSVHRLLVTANVPSSLILVTLMMEALSSSQTSVLTRATWHHISEDGTLHSHRRENLTSYIEGNMIQGSDGSEPSWHSFFKTKNH
jgi:hypothetical protein